MAGRGASRVPERWTDYIPLGRRMPGTRFIAFKVPLKESFDQNLLPEERFSPHDLITKVKERKEELGLIIDLTYTTRYYGREELPPTLRYSKILTMGHEIPNRRTILRFKYLVKKFLADNKDNDGLVLGRSERFLRKCSCTSAVCVTDKLIGVHCTHGLNRTGYLVCRYLIDVEGMEPNAAIELFNESRGHPIERANYIQDLQKRALKSSCDLKNLGSDLLRRKGSAPAKPQKQLVKHHPSQPPLAVPRNPGSAKKKQRPDPTAQGQPQELGHRHGALGQRQLEQRQQNHLEQRQQNHLEQRQQNHLEQRQQNHLEQRQQKKLEQKQQKKLKHLEQRQNHLEQRQQERQNHLEQRQQNQLEQRQKNHLEQRQQKKLKHLEQRQQNHLEQRQLERQNHLDQRQNHLEQRQNHLEQRQLERQNHLEQRQNHLEQRQPCSFPPRNCWLSPAPKKKHKELFPPQSPQPWLPQEPSRARKRRHRHRKRELKEEMS
ncbi:RNA/RNP complex-1-interacting phosphatase isoform X7 [Hirundo rustica]|uniref:RNA/RNP complex-1-interacting phosphatase isoform X7 n=1 Tax=Hirundo rustica TaxID=43150 RepID=UPI002673139C|nr:RNA/RNP complex-1-interacting phosphatase isoform X7 [Hirundo rustica]